MRVWKVLKQLTALSSSILSIIFYSGSQNFVDAFFTVYLCFYAALAPLLIVSDIYKLIKAPRGWPSGAISSAEQPASRHSARLQKVSKTPVFKG